MKPARFSLLVPLALCGAILAVSTASLFIRYTQQEQVPSLVIAAWRLTLATLLLAPLALGRYRADLRRLRWDRLWPCLLAGVFLAFHFAAWITSLEYTSVASSVVLVTTTPLWVALAAPILLRERTEAVTMAGMFLALSGGAILALGSVCPFEADAPRLVCAKADLFGRGSAFIGDALALCGAWMAAGYVLIGRKVRARIALIPYLFLVYGSAALLLVGVALAARQQLFHHSPLVYLWLFLLALVPQLIGHSTLNWALRRLPAAFVSVALLGEPVGSSVLAAIFLGEKPLPAEITGGAIILVGIALASRQSNIHAARDKKHPLRNGQ